MSSVTWEGPSPIQCSTSVTKRITLHLNAFRGEPAISAFDWHFTRLPTVHPSILQHTTVRASTGSYARFPLTMGRSRSFGSIPNDKIALFGLAFATAPHRKCLTRPLRISRRSIMQKVRRQTFDDREPDAGKSSQFSIFSSQFMRRGPSPLAKTDN